MRPLLFACASGLLVFGIGGVLAPRRSQHDWFEEFSPDFLADAPAGGPVKYSYQSFAQSTVLDPDGRPRTERFAASDVGDRARGLREARQAYSTSESQYYKTSHERFIDAQAVKLSVEHNRETGEAHSHERVRGLDAAGRESFDQEFEAKREHLPRLTREGSQDRATEWVKALPERPAVGAGASANGATELAGEENK